MGWKEHWRFLDCVCDLSNKEGLEALESYLDTNCGSNREDIADGMANLSLSITPKRNQRNFLTGYDSRATMLVLLTLSYRSQPSKLDYDVLIAVGQDIDLWKYPNVKKWHTLVRSYSEEDQRR